MKTNKDSIKTKKLKLKDVYIKNKNRRLNEIVGIKDCNASLVSNAKETIAKNKYIIILVSVIIIALLLSTMYNDLSTFFITLGFLIGIAIIVTIFNSFKLICTKDGITLSFGFQKAFLQHDKLKCIYLSKYDSYSFLRFAKDYNIIIKYVDNNGYIKELSFSTLFLTPMQIDTFLNNFIIENKNSEEVVKYEKFKLIRKIAKTLFYILFIGTIIALYFIK